MKSILRAYVTANDKSNCLRYYLFRRKVEAYARCIEAVNCAVKILGEVIGSQLEKLLEVSEKCKSVTKITSAQMAFVEASHGSHVRIMELFSPRTEVVRRGLQFWREI